MTCELNETFSRADLERIVFYMLSTGLLFYIAQSVISDDRLRRSLRLADPHGLTKIPIQVIGKCDGYNCTYAANESIYKMVSNVSRMQFFFYNVHRTLTSLLLMCYKELVHCYFSTKNQPTVDQLSVRLSVIC